MRLSGGERFEQELEQLRQESPIRYAESSGLPLGHAVVRSREPGRIASVKDNIDQYDFRVHRRRDLSDARGKAFHGPHFPG